MAHGVAHAIPLRQRKHISPRGTLRSPTEPHKITNKMFADDFQNGLFQLMKAEKRAETNASLILKNLVEPHQFEVAKYNRKTTDMDDEERSQRLWRMMNTHETQTMICKEIDCRVSRRIRKQQLGYEPFWYTLFDGCHRKDLTDQFLAGKCYVKILNPEDNCYYYCWNTQEAVDAVTEYKEYHVLLSDELRARLLKCPISMIYLDSKMSDTEAYHRAKIANQCKPLSNAQIMKCMCSKNTVMANLLVNMNVDNVLSEFLDDDLYRYNVSLIRMFVEHSFDGDFTPHIAMLQGRNAIERAEDLINDEEKPHDDLFARKVLEAATNARSIMNRMIAEHEPALRKTDHTQKSAVGLIYLSLTLACANSNEMVLATSEYINKEAAEYVFDMYMGFDASEKGDNHKRFYTYFTTGTFPDSPLKTKKRKQGSGGASSAEQEEEDALV